MLILKSFSYILSAQATSETPIDYATFPDIRQPGNYGVISCPVE